MFVMGGLIEDFDEFHDATNNISDPRQVAPHWEAASRQHGMPVDAAIWREDPPRSIYPASIATKAAKFQDPRLGFRCLRRLREVVATERGNIEKRSVLIEIAAELGLDMDRFIEALDNGQAEDAFTADLRTTQSHSVRGFPTFHLDAGSEDRLLGGYQSFDYFETALTELAPSLERRDPPSVTSLISTYGYVATQEVAEIYEWDVGKAEQVLRGLASSDIIRSVDRGNGTFWIPNDDNDIDRIGTGELAHRGELPWDA